MYCYSPYMPSCSGQGQHCLLPLPSPVLSGQHIMQIKALLIDSVKVCAKNAGLLNTNYLVSKNKWQKFLSYCKINIYTYNANCNFCIGRTQLQAVSNSVSKAAVSYTGLHSHLVPHYHANVSLFLTWVLVTLLLHQLQDIQIELVPLCINTTLHRYRTSFLYLWN